MNEAFIDVSRLSFWAIFVAAVALLVPITAPAARKWTWAAVNVAFLATLLSPGQLNAVLVAVLAVHLALQAAGAGRGRGLVALGLGAGTLGLFLIRKLPITAVELGWGAANPILVAVGFSYVALRICDVLRAVIEGRQPAPDLPATINYLLPFHMLAAGPIQAYDEFVAQPAVPPPPTALDTLEAAERIARGLFKKFVLAHVLKSLFLTGFRARGPYLLVEAQVFYLWLYLDFSGLSDLAVGMGRLIGAATPENFHRPYLARNIIVFWERWHISLSQFIRRNLFIPVQLWLMRRSGGMHPLWCASAAFIVSFALCGLWHGVSIRFLGWGLLHAAGLVTVNLYRHYLTRGLGTRGVKDYMNYRGIRVISTFLTFEFVCLSLVVVVYPYSFTEFVDRSFAHGYSLGR
jgi:D-alanyl-lipoteichoic acid acyltransferase DltB (MBOAT superfamily)